MATNSSEGDKKFTVNHYHQITRFVDSLRHQQERDVKPKSRLQKNCSEAKNAIQGMTLIVVDACLV